MQEQSFNELKKKFKQWKFVITKIEEVQKNYPSLNIYFKTNNKKAYNLNKISLNYPTKRLERIFKRIFSEKITIKDIFFSFLWKYKIKVF